ncbi:CRISPR-associated endoribonuclease Cas6 [Konateibacter massiliensis]|uniref:CRISPR-associated endoribonuclease Cas6 n=1 Tax=Konateibacter massiliensis TaxID=2002841 RepID=UPI0015D4E1F4|nr:CRISPR-associated endoribonuclease Cas6 [Konateibacter massiliensis]
MKFCLDFYLQGNYLHKDFRKCIASFFKKSLTEANEGKYFDRFYKDTCQKNYTWHLVMHQPQYKKDQIILGDNEIKLIVSTDNVDGTGFILYSAFMGQKHKEFPLPNSNSMVLKNVSQLKERIITKEKALFKTAVGSPVCIREHNRETNKDRYYSVVDNEFSAVTTEALKRQAKEAGFLEEDVEQIKFIPIQCKKIVVEHYACYIDATVGMFELHGPSLLLQHFYQNGIGSRRSIGFGMIQVAD